MSDPDAAQMATNIETIKASYNKLADKVIALTNEDLELKTRIAAQESTNEDLRREMTRIVEGFEIVKKERRSEIVHAEEREAERVRAEIEKTHLEVRYKDLEKQLKAQRYWKPAAMVAGFIAALALSGFTPPLSLFKKKRPASTTKH